MICSLERVRNDSSPRFGRRLQVGQLAGAVPEAVPEAVPLAGPRPFVEHIFVVLGPGDERVGRGGGHRPRGRRPRRRRPRRRRRGGRERAAVRVGRAALRLLEVRQRQQGRPVGGRPLRRRRVRRVVVVGQAPGLGRRVGVQVLGVLARVHGHGPPSVRHALLRHQLFLLVVEHTLLGRLRLRGVHGLLTGPVRGETRFRLVGDRGRVLVQARVRVQARIRVRGEHEAPVILVTETRMSRGVRKKRKPQKPREASEQTPNSLRRDRFTITGISCTITPYTYPCLKRSSKPYTVKLTRRHQPSPISPLNCTLESKFPEKIAVHLFFARSGFFTPRLYVLRMRKC